MKLLADECLYLITTMCLRKHGHDVLTIQETGFIGIENGEVAELANKEKRVLITRDMHFCNILKFPPENYNGIIDGDGCPDNFKSSIDSDQFFTDIFHSGYLNPTPSAI